jgi:hypothetical protein
MFCSGVPDSCLSGLRWLLIKHAPNLYSPSQYSGEITPEAYRIGISQADSLLLGRAVAETVAPLLEISANERIEDSAVELAARRFEASIERSSILVTLTPPLKPRPIGLQIPAVEGATIEWLLDTIYYAIESSVKPFTYGETWMLFRGSNGSAFAEMGTSWARSRKWESDTRPIGEVGIGPGGQLTAARIERLTVRNVITGARASLMISPGRTVKEVVNNSEFIAKGILFSVRDKRGYVVDDRPAADFAGLVLNVGIPGDLMTGDAEAM